MPLLRFFIAIFIAISFTVHATAGEATLKQTEVVELANAAAKAKKIPLDHYLPPKVSYDRKTESWRVYYGSKIPLPGDFFDIRLHDRTKETKILPGA